MFFTLKSLACLAAIVVALLALLAFLAHIRGGNSRDFLRAHPIVPLAFLLLLSALGIWAVKVVENYMYPKDKAVFKNVDYHLLEHRGFSFDSILYLVQNNAAEVKPEVLRQEALWDMKEGTLYLTHDSLVAQNFYEPLYCATEVKNDCVFTLQNVIVPDAIEKTGLTLSVGEDTLTLSIEPYSEGFIKRKNNCRYICKYNNSPADTSTFKRVIQKSYPLSEIVSRCRNLNFPDDFMNLLEGAYLTRRQVRASLNGRELSEKNTSDLLFFPGRPLYIGNEIVVNGKELAHFPVNKRFVVAVTPDFRFYVGSGLKKSDVFKVSQKEDSHVELLYVMPKMKQLRPQDGQLFITSSGEVAASTFLAGGYFYNIFDEEDNANHINGKIKYFVGSSRDSMFFRVQDIYADSDKKLYTANEDFLLSGRLKMGNQFKWIFQVVDLRSTNPLQWKHFMIFIVLFILTVGARLIMEALSIKYWGRTSSLTFIEMSVYVVAFCFGIVRLILAWRMSTFVPYGDISADAFAYLRNGYSPWLTTTICIIILPLALGVIAFFKEWLNERISLAQEGFNWKGKFICWQPWHLVALFITFLILCFVMGHIMFPVAFNIPLPVIGYFFVGWWLNTLLSKEKYQEIGNNYRVALLGLLIAYLLFTDAGYAAIFVLCFILYLFVICPLVTPYDESIFSERMSVRRVNIVHYGIVVVFGVLFYLCVRKEGWFIIEILDHFAWCVLVGSALVAGLIVVQIKKVHYANRWKRVLRSALLVLVALVALDAVLNLVGSGNWLNDLAATKGHMKYRAKVQQLKPGEHIDDLLMQNELNSSDVTYIMRSAHNQWFINQYADCYDTNGPAFQLKPHFQQGSSYTTQTTDLVVTRYVLAEHGGKLLFWLVAGLLLIVIIYSIENPIGRSRSHRFIMLALLLLYLTALFVFLSATNRIVFVGQDFPFLSITSRIAVAFPIILFLVAILRTMFENENEETTDDREIIRHKWQIPAAMLSLTLACIYCISPMGRASQGEKLSEKQFSKRVDEQFDVSKLISDISHKIESIDKEFVDYQMERPGKGDAGNDSLWHSFLNQYLYETSADEQQSALQMAFADSIDKGKFFHTLLFDYFTNEQVHKDDPEELIHMRRRNGTFHLCVNKKHYSISSVMNDDIQWTGEILAAEKPLRFGFVDLKTSSNKKKSYTNEDYIVNVLNFSLDDESLKAVPNITLSWFDSTWTDLGEPLLIVRSDIAKGSKEYFHIENDTESIRGTSQKEQIATRIIKNDMLSLNVMKNGKEKNVILWTYGLDSEDFLARNLWINGHRQLFYPLGKESMWSYNFANLVSDVYGKNPALKDSSIRVSIDYQLHKQFYDIVKKQSHNVLSLDVRTVEKLVDFRMLDCEKQRSPKNGSGFYFDTQSKTLKSCQPKLNRTAVAVNQKAAALEAQDPTLTRMESLKRAIDAIASANFDYSAVVLDGNGRIRLLFDYDRKRNVNPNNITFLNRFLRELYMDGSVATEREIFGNKSLSLLVPGPGSSFKPIAYTAITGQRNLGWKDLTVDPPESADFCKDLEFYGGVPREGSGDKKWSLEYYGGTKADNYIRKSDNLYHSVVIMLGNQKIANMKDILKEAGAGPEAFPVISLGGKKYSFNPDKWYANGTALVNKTSALVVGLGDNFRVACKNMQLGGWEYDYTYYGEQFVNLREGNAALRGWAFPETGSLNTADKHSLRKGFFQMALGANPLEVSPLQMASLGMRLVTLNRYETLTTLRDAMSAPAGYEFFTIGNDWQKDDFIKFQREIVFTQMRDNFVSGTAKDLGPIVNKWKKQGYHFYAKTGTLNVTERGTSRLKHLLVIISDKPLETMTSEEELRNVHYYVLYLSYIGIDKDDFNMKNFAPFIDAVMKSETFNYYMCQQ